MTARWWSQKYNRPATDVAFTSQPLAFWYKEMLADYHEQRSELIEKLRSGGEAYNRNQLLKAIQALDKFLSTEVNAEVIVTGDPLADEWERELEKGRIPESLKKGIVKRHGR